MGDNSMISTGEQVNVNLSEYNLYSISTYKKFTKESWGKCRLMLKKLIMMRRKQILKIFNFQAKEDAGGYH